jgi:superfamily II DNA/RNA helicase
MSFADLGLSDELLQSVIAAGYDTPTPIQAQAIPSVLMMRDLIGIAQTGTGKTASFVLPMIDILAHGRRRALMPRSLILNPRANWPRRWPRISRNMARTMISRWRC